MIRSFFGEREKIESNEFDFSRFLILKFMKDDDAN